MIMRGITGKINKKTEEAIFKANRRMKNLLTIIDEMKDYAYMEIEKEVKYKTTGIKLKTVIDNNLDLFSDQAIQKDINLV